MFIEVLLVGTGIVTLWAYKKWKGTQGGKTYNYEIRFYATITMIEKYSADSPIPTKNR